MEIKTTKEIIDEQFITTEEERSLRRIKLNNLREDINKYNLKEWINVSQILEELNNIRDVIRECSFEDDFGEQCFKYCDLNNMFKILESELIKDKKSTNSLKEE